jgi:hypothetical protein
VKTGFKSEVFAEAELSRQQGRSATQKSVK